MFAVTVSHRLYDRPNFHCTKTPSFIIFKPVSFPAWSYVQSTTLQPVMEFTGQVTCLPAGPLPTSIHPDKDPCHPETIYAQKCMHTLQTDRQTLDP